MNGKADSKPPAAKADTESNLGVLYTGYVDKQNPVTGSYHKRFLVLTQESLHWFNRSDSSDLLGNERGHIPLTNILSARILDNDGSSFETKDLGGRLKKFRCSSTNISEEWVSAIKSAIKRLHGPNRRASITGGGQSKFLPNFRSMLYTDDADMQQSTVEVNVLLVSISSKHGTTEYVVARNPKWNNVILLNSIKAGDELVISTSNGGIIKLSSDFIEDKCEGMEFEQPLQSVTLASSLKLSIRKISTNTESQKQTPSNKLLLVLYIALTASRTHTVLGLLALATLLVCCSSLAFIGSETVLLLVITIFLAILTLFAQYSDANTRYVKSTEASNNYCLVIHCHAFTSPDAPIVEPEDEIPQRFLIGCDMDKKEARRRWDITRHWRESEGVNQILEQPQPHFFVIKEWYPHFHAGRGKLGHYVYYERPGEFDSSQFTARGVTVDDLIQHFLFITEYQWRVMCNNDETAKSITVIDVANVSLSDLAGDPLEYLKKSLGIANQHYPERSYVIFIVNAPGWFSMLWRVVRPLVHENTQKKIRILSRSATLAGLQEHIDVSNIPAYYGGELKFTDTDISKHGLNDSCRLHSPEVVAFNEFVTRLNNKESNAAAAEQSTISTHPSESPSTRNPAMEAATPVVNNVPFVASPRANPRASIMTQDSTTLSDASSTKSANSPVTPMTASGRTRQSIATPSSMTSLSPTPAIRNNAIRR